MIDRVLRLLIDLVLVSLFALVGRRSHEEVLSLAGWWTTAWPFLAGVVVGWLLVAALRLSPASLSGGGVVWVSTVGVAMLLRTVTDAGTAAPFVVVATLTTGLLLLGSRLLLRRGRSGSGRGGPPTSAEGWDGTTRDRSAALETDRKDLS